MNLVDVARSGCKVCKVGSSTLTNCPLRGSEKDEKKRTRHAWRKEMEDDASNSNVFKDETDELSG